MSSGGWNTIESDAGVFTYLLESLGVKGVQFDELLSIHEPIPPHHQPLYGILLLFKYPFPQASSTSPHNTGTSLPEASSTLFFASQTIQNACATQALLSVLLNQDKQPDIDIGDTLREFKDFTEGFPPEFRGEALSNSERIREVHNSFARSSPFVNETQQLATNPEDAEDVYHFIAYTPIDGALWELDGLQPAPISHGACEFEDFAAKVMPVLQERVGRYGEGEIRFAVLTMVRDLRIGYKEVGDIEGEMVEAQRREEWRIENALRRWNFVGFAGEVLKGVVREKLSKGDGKFEEWVERAKGVTRKRLEERRKRGGGDEDVVMEE